MSAEAQNAHRFTGVGRSYWRAIASGLRPSAEPFAKGPDGWRLQLEPDTDGHAFRSGGIVNAREYPLSPDRYYYRFISTQQLRKHGPESALSGWWWLRNEDGTRLRHYADEWGEPLASVARRALCIPPERGDCAWLVRVLLTRPMRAWAGAGAPASAGISAAHAGRDRERQPLVAGLAGADPILQLFVPQHRHRADADSGKSPAKRGQAETDGPFRFVDA